MSKHSIVTPTSLEQFKHTQSAAQTLDEILRLVEELDTKFEYYAFLHGKSPHSLAAEKTENDIALRWMQTSLEDITATLRGISI